MESTEKILPNIWGRNNTSSIQTLPEYRRGRNTIQFIFQITQIPNQRHYKQRSLQTNTLHEHRVKHPEQNISKWSPTIHEILMSNEVYSGNARLVQQSKPNHCNSPYQQTLLKKNCMITWCSPDEKLKPRVEKIHSWCNEGVTNLVWQIWQIQI